MNNTKNMFLINSLAVPLTLLLTFVLTVSGFAFSEILRAILNATSIIAIAAAIASAVYYRLDISEGSAVFYMLLASAVFTAFASSTALTARVAWNLFPVLQAYVVFIVFCATISGIVAAYAADEVNDIVGVVVVKRLYAILCSVLEFVAILAILHYLNEGRWVVPILIAVFSAAVAVFVWLYFWMQYRIKEAARRRSGGL
jgi:hypothetical protein